jgi:hypothetical protein
MGDMPILIAGSGRMKTLRLVARHADSWHAGFPDDASELDPAVEALRGWCDREGRDIAEIEWGLGVEPNDLGRFLAEDAPRFVEKGFTQFTIGFQGPDWDVARAADWLRWRDEMNG